MFTLFFLSMIKPFERFQTATLDIKSFGKAALNGIRNIIKFRKGVQHLRNELGLSTPTIGRHTNDVIAFQMLRGFFITSDEIIFGNILRLKTFDEFIGAI